MTDIDQRDDLSLSGRVRRQGDRQQSANREFVFTLESVKW